MEVASGVKFSVQFSKDSSYTGWFLESEMSPAVSAQKVKKVVTLIRVRGLRFQPCFLNSFSLKRAGKCVKKVKARGQTQPGLEPAKRTQKTPVNAINIAFGTQNHYDFSDKVSLQAQ